MGASTNDLSGYEHATEWSGGSVIDLGELPGSTRSDAYGINDAGFVVGVSEIGGIGYATEWIGRAIINLGGLPGSTMALLGAINNFGQAVGFSVSQRRLARYGMERRFGHRPRWFTGELG